MNPKIFLNGNHYEIQINKKTVAITNTKKQIDEKLKEIRNDKS